MDCGENAEGLVFVHTVLEMDPGEPSNMTVLLAFEWTQGASQSFRLNDFAWRNIESILITRDTSHFDTSPLNVNAFWNIPSIFLTFDTSHFEMSARKSFALENVRLISITFATFHPPIGPNGPMMQEPSGTSLRHAATAFLNSALDRGTNPRVAVKVTVTGRLWIWIVGEILGG